VAAIPHLTGPDQASLSTLFRPVVVYFSGKDEPIFGIF
jgi:hypothetical protein